MIRQFESSLPAGRQRMLALGRHYHEALAEVARRGLPAALELVDTLGWCCAFDVQPMPVRPLP
jgi:hypothetical protein